MTRGEFEVDQRNWTVLRLGADRWRRGACVSLRPAAESLLLPERAPSRMLDFLWRRERITYTRLLSALARYSLTWVCRRGSPSSAPQAAAENKNERLMIRGATGRQSNWTRSQRVCALSPSYARSVSTFLYSTTRGDVLNVIHRWSSLRRECGLYGRGAAGS